SSLPNPINTTHDLLLAEEVSSHTNPLPQSPHRALNLGSSRRYQTHIEPCYGKEAVRIHQLKNVPILCSGTILGTKTGMHLFLTVLVEEFVQNNQRGPMCQSPSTTDQWTMNHLHYTGRFGYPHQTKTFPWGTGAVLTMGKPCVDSSVGDKKEKKGHSQIDLVEFDSNGMILNRYELESSPMRIALTLHQWDSCWGWMGRWLRSIGGCLWEWRGWRMKSMCIGSSVIEILTGMGWTVDNGQQQLL
ncbi:hypothetical protein ACHAWX_000145, partial [Stephanocyclus meneghinianus]